MGAWYTTRETVKAALDSKETARDDAAVDAAIASASRDVEALCHRIFYPRADTKYFDWPNAQYAPSYRLWLDENDLISVTTLTSGGTTISSQNYFLEPQRSGPPYTRLDLNIGTNAAFDSGDTFQRSIAVTGLFGYRDDSESAGALAEPLDASETDVDVSNAAAIGVGDLIQIDDERAQVTGRVMISTGYTLNGGIDAQKNTETLSVTGSGTAPAVGEVILIDSERMLVVDAISTTLTVKRAWDGSTLAAHSNGATISAGRRLSVTRGAYGTTAATHSDATAITRWVPPSGVEDLTVAEAVVKLQRRASGYGTNVGTGANRRSPQAGDLEDLRRRVYAVYGRQARSRAV